MENYIVINGKRAELTTEQLKALGIEAENKSPFAKPFSRARKGEIYYWMISNGRVAVAYDFDERITPERFDVANYCTDKAIMEQRALHETLQRLLWRYSMEHNGDKIKCGGFSIYSDDGIFKTVYSGYKYFEPTFLNETIAENAIKEIIIPFMKAHPDFRI